MRHVARVEGDLIDAVQLLAALEMRDRQRQGIEALLFGSDAPDGSRKQDAMREVEHAISIA